MLKELSIIIPVKNRSKIQCNFTNIQLKTFERHRISTTGFKDEVFKIKDKIELRLLLRCLESLQNIKERFEEFEVIIVDFGSKDFDMKKLESKYPDLTIKLIKVNDYFSRGRGLNIGFKHSTKENMFFCDTDMLFKTREVFDIAYKYMEDNRAYFPICFDLCEPTHQIGYWRTSGYGMVFMNKKTYGNYEWSEYNSLGKEDNDIWAIFGDNAIRERVNGYFHQWHPATFDFKNKYYKHNRTDIPKLYCDLREIDFDLIKRAFSRHTIYITNKLEFKLSHCIVSSYIGLYHSFEYKKNFNKELVIFLYLNMMGISNEEYKRLQQILISCPDLKKTVIIVNNLQEFFFKFK